MKCLGRSVAVKSRTFVAIGLEEQFPLGWVAGAMWPRAAAGHLWPNMGKREKQFLMKSLKPWVQFHELFKFPKAWDGKFSFCILS